MSEKTNHPVVVLEGSPLGTPTSRAFATVEDAESYVLERVRALVNPNLKARAESAIADRIVSEDGLKAVAEVLTSKLDFLRALAKAYAPKITVSVRQPEVREDD
jgi:hypothetical protein